MWYPHLDVWGNKHAKTNLFSSINVFLAKMQSKQSCYNNLAEAK